MNSFKSHKQNLQLILEMLDKGRLISRRQVARQFGCSEDSITNLINELREEGYSIHYSRSLQKYILHKKNEPKK